MKLDKPIYVIADDFSGAAEMAGIGYRYGLSSTLLTIPVFDAQTDLLVINADTRSKSQSEARNTMRQISEAIHNANRSFYCFKKIDSVLRGHILEEAGELMHWLGYKRSFLMPANPSKNRIIKDGQYFIDGTLLENTPFQNDPDFPRYSSKLDELLVDSTLHYQHNTGKKLWPSQGAFSIDVQNFNDIKKAIASLETNDFCCGAADAFEAILQILGVEKAPDMTVSSVDHSCLTIIVNGSTFNESDDFLQVKADRVFAISEYLTGIETKEDLTGRLHKYLSHHDLVYINTGLDYIDDKQVAKNIEQKIAKLMQYVLSKLSHSPIHLYLTGGATANAIINGLKLESFNVIGELGPGVVTLSNDRFNGHITTKPGSYPWHTSFFTDHKNINSNKYA